MAVGDRDYGGFVCFKQKTAYEMRISDWSSDVCSSDLAVDDAAPLARGDMVIARVPIAFRMLAARRHYLPANVPLVKRVAATVGDEVCAVGARVTVNGRLAAKRQTRDGAGRSEERRVGKECGRRWRSRWSTTQEKKKEEFRKDVEK